MKKIWLALFGIISKDMPKISKSIASNALCRRSFHLKTNMVVQVGKGVSYWDENLEKISQGKERSGEWLHSVYLTIFHSTIDA